MNPQRKTEMPRTARRSAVGSQPGAFTLIELLMVISIIGLLAALVIGLVKIVGPRKAESAAKTELRELELVIENYKSRLGPYPPDTTNNPALALL